MFGYFACGTDNRCLFEVESGSDPRIQNSDQSRAGTGGKLSGYGTDSGGFRRCRIPLCHVSFSELCDIITNENTDENGYWKKGIDVSDFKWLYSFEDDDIREKQFLKVFNERFPDYVKRFDTEYLVKMYHFLITKSNIYHEEPDDWSATKINYRIIPRQVY